MEGGGEAQPQLAWADDKIKEETKRKEPNNSNRPCARREKNGESLINKGKLGTVKGGSDFRPESMLGRKKETGRSMYVKKSMVFGGYHKMHQQLVGQ